MLTQEQINRLSEERNRIMRFTQELRELADEGDSFFFSCCHSAANIFTDGCYEVDRIILEGSAEIDA